MVDYYKDYPFAHLLPPVGAYVADHATTFPGFGTLERRLLLWMLHPIPHKRPTAEEALQHPLFDDFIGEWGEGVNLVHPDHFQSWAGWARTIALTAAMRQAEAEYARSLGVE